MSIEGSSCHDEKHEYKMLTRPMGQPGHLQQSRIEKAHFIFHFQISSNYFEFHIERQRQTKKLKHIVRMMSKKISCVSNPLLSLNRIRLSRSNSRYQFSTIVRADEKSDSSVADTENIPVGMLKIGYPVQVF